MSASRVTKRRSKHDCWIKADKALAERNACLSVVETINRITGEPGYALEVPTVKLDSRNRKPLPRLLASYCPICGEKL